MHRTAFTRGAADGSLLFNPFDMQLKNVANTGVLHWANKLLALYEVSHKLRCLHMFHTRCTVFFRAWVDSRQNRSTW